MHCVANIICQSVVFLSFLKKVAFDDQKFLILTQPHLPISSFVSLCFMCPKVQGKNVIYLHNKTLLRRARPYHYLPQIYFHCFHSSNHLYTRISLSSHRKKICCNILIRIKLNLYYDWGELTSVILNLPLHEHGVLLQ